jgi:hypothetical protein
VALVRELKRKHHGGRRALVLRLLRDLVALRSFRRVVFLVVLFCVFVVLVAVRGLVRHVFLVVVLRLVVLAVVFGLPKRSDEWGFF